MTKKIDYNDIDVLVLTEGNNKDIENNLYNSLIDKFNLNFHLISFDEKKLNELLEICPLTRSMLYYYASNKDFKIPKKTKINEKHIRFLLMMPEDLLEVDLDYGIEYYNTLRKLCVIENFLIGKETSPDNIDVYLENLLGRKKLALLKRNDIIEKNLLEEVKATVKNKLEKIYGRLNHGQKK